MSGPVRAGTEGRGVLERAAGLLRAAPVPAWRHTAVRVVSAARTVGRSGSPIAAGAPGGTVWVSDLVLRSSVRAAVAAIAGASPVSVTVNLAGDRVRSVAVGVAVVYGQQIEPVVRSVRQATDTTLRLLLGPHAPNSDALDVHIVDVVTAADLPVR